MLGIYVAGHTIKFNNFKSIFTRHDRRWTSVLIFVQQISGAVE